MRGSYLLAYQVVLHGIRDHRAIKFAYFHIVPRNINGVVDLGRVALGAADALTFFCLDLFVDSHPSGFADDRPVYPVRDRLL